MDARTLPTSSDLRGWASALVSSSTKAAKCLDDECFWMRRSDSEVDRAVKSSLLRHSMSSGLSARRGGQSVSFAGGKSTRGRGERGRTGQARLAKEGRRRVHVGPQLGRARLCPQRRRVVLALLLRSRGQLEVEECAGRERGRGGTDLALLLLCLAAVLLLLLEDLLLGDALVAHAADGGGGLLGLVVIVALGDVPVVLDVVVRQVLVGVLAALLDGGDGGRELGRGRRRGGERCGGGGSRGLLVGGCVCAGGEATERRRTRRGREGGRARVSVRRAGEGLGSVTDPSQSPWWIESEQQVRCERQRAEERRADEERLAPCPRSTHHSLVQGCTHCSLHLALLSYPPSSTRKRSPPTPPRSPRLLWIPASPSRRPTPADLALATAMPHQRDSLLGQLPSLDRAPRAHSRAPSTRSVQDRDGNDMLDVGTQGEQVPLDLVRPLSCFLHESRPRLTLPFLRANSSSRSTSTPAAPRRPTRRLLPPTPATPPSRPTATRPTSSPAGPRPSRSPPARATRPSRSSPAQSASASSSRAAQVSSAATSSTASCFSGTTSSSSTHSSAATRQPCPTGCASPSSPTSSASTCSRLTLLTPSLQRAPQLRAHPRRRRRAYPPRGRPGASRSRAASPLRSDPS